MNVHRHQADTLPSNGPRLLSPADIRDLARLLSLTPTKKLGQNFVHDPNTVRRIVRVAAVSAGENVLEVGPGLGSLTLGLVEAGAHVIAVEIDPRLAAQLPHTVGVMQPGRDVTVIASDVLVLKTLPMPPERLVANLPYNVSVPVLLHLLYTFPTIRSGVVMVQSEVGRRLAAEPGSKVYGVPSVKAAWYGDWSVTGDVSRMVFWPVPNVDSVLVSFTRRSPCGTETERLRTFALADAAFRQRRKMLRQSLAATLELSPQDTAAVITAVGLDPEARGEQLSVHDFLAIARATLT